MTGRMDYSKAEMRRQLKNEEDKYRKTVRLKSGILLTAVAKSQIQLKNVLKNCLQQRSLEKKLFA